MDASSEDAKESATAPYAASAVGRARQLLDEMPDTIGPYRILERIGQGGMGEVLRAEQREPIRREVALKLIKLGMDTKLVLARFEAERQALALMDHPHIAKVFEASADESGRPYFVMEYVRGRPITEYADLNHLTIPERLQLFCQVCQAIQHAHQKGIIHRDVKPSNVLVSTQDGKPFAKVIDFGIVKATATQLTERTLYTLHDQFIGTPQYMSPEQAEGSADIDTRTDVYSLGVLLYELLTGTTPFGGAELHDAALEKVKRIIRESDPPKPSTRLSQSGVTLSALAAARRTEPTKLGALVRGELDWIVMSAMEKDRRRRYDSPNSLADDVQRHLDGRPVEAAPPSRGYQLVKFAQRNRLPVAAAATLLVLLSGFAAVVSTLAVQLKRSAEVAASKQAEAEAERQVALLAGHQAREATDKAAVAEKQAVQSRDDVRRQLAKNYVQKGVELANWQSGTGTIGGRVTRGALRSDDESGWGTGDPMQAALWFLKALETDPDPDNEELHRIRIASSLVQCPEITGYCFHPDRVAGSVVSADGSRLLSWQRGSEAYFWDLSRAGLLFAPLKHEGTVSCGAISADGKLLATGGTDKTVRLWSAEEGTSLAPPIIHEAPVTSVIFHPVKRIVITGCADKRIRFWNLDTELTEVASIACTGTPKYIGLSADGLRLLSWDEANQACVWDTTSGDPLIDPVTHASARRSYPPSWDARSERLLVADATGLTLIDLNSNRSIAQTPVVGRGISDSSLSSDGRTAIFCTDVSGDTLWNVDEGKTFVLPLPRQGRFAVFSPNGSLIATTSTGGRVQVWDAKTRQALYDGFLSTTHLESIAFTSDSEKLIYSDNFHRLRVVNIFPKPRRPEAPDRQSLDAPQRMAPIGIRGSNRRFSVSGPYRRWRLEYGGGSGADLVETQANAERRVRLPTDEPVLFAAFGNSGKCFLTSTKNHLSVRSLPDGKPAGAEIPIESTPGKAWFDRNDRRILVVTPEQGFLIDRLKDSITFKHFDLTFKRENETEYYKSSISDNGMHLVLLGASFGDVRTYDVQADTLMRLSDRAMNGYVWASRFGPYTNRFVLACSSTYARAYEANGTPAGPPLTHDYYVRDAALGYGGRIAVTVLANGSALAWDVETGTLLTFPDTLESEISDLWFSDRDDKIVMSIGRNRQRWWRLPTIDLRLPQLKTYIQFVTNHQIDDTGGLIQLPFGDPEAARLAWLAAQDLDSDLLDTPSSLLPEPFLDPPIEQLKAFVGQEVEITMNVVSAGGNESTLYLNSQSNHTRGDSFSIRILPSGLAQLRETLETSPFGYYVGKKVRCHGRLHLNQFNQLRVEVNDVEKQLSLASEQPHAPTR